MKSLVVLGVSAALLGGCGQLLTSSSSSDKMPASWSLPPRAAMPAKHASAPRPNASTQNVRGFAQTPAALERTCNRPWPSPSAEQAVLALVNAQRSRGATCGGTYYPPVPALQADERLQCAARLHAADMAIQKYFAHDNLLGQSPADRVTQTGYRWSVAGENIAAGQPTPAQVVSAWMESPGHCVNIMSPQFTELGIGYVAARDQYGHYWAQSFGRPR